MGGKEKGIGRGRVKRQQVESEDGWTIVTHGLSNLSVNSKTSNVRKESESQSFSTKVVEGSTSETLLSEFKKLQGRWRDTTVAKQIVAIIDKKDWHIESAVCIGIGSFARDWEHRHRSMWQLVLFVDVIQHLDEKSKGYKKVQMYAQDPAFTPLDIEFLKVIDIMSIERDIEKHIMVESFVYSPFVDWYLLLPTFLASKDPVLYVGNEILDDYSAYAQTGEKKEKQDECDKLGRTFLNGRESMKLRDFELHAHALNGMIMYWKTPVD
ncbi:hypothetical protein GQ44DRAFT_613700 [Phaeosphaeriaceae sp. PMI808]|nr:hypothetical protein GQ44DRAFT_613700 [Phaeosphaeriaceae sp. PMI808]